MMSSISPTRRLRLAAGVATAGLVTGLALTAVPAAANAEPGAPVAPTAPVAKKASGTYSFYATKTVKSSKKKRIRVGLSGSGDNQYLSVNLGKSKESHNWSFKIAKKNVKITSNGAGTVKSKVVKKFGVLNMKIVPTKKWKKDSCKGTLLSKTRPVTLKGAFQFDSKGSWGKVGAKRNFSMKGLVTFYSGKDGSACYNYTEGCSPAYISWYHGKGNTSLNGYVQGKKSYIYGYRSVKVSKKITRTDSITVNVPKPKLTKSETGSGIYSGTLAIKGKGAAKGSAKLTGTGYKTTGKCKGKNETRFSFYPATFTNGSTKLALKMNIYGKLTLGNSSDASFNQLIK